MKLTFKKMTVESVPACVQTMVGSLIFERYFGNTEAASRMIKKAAEQNQLYGAVTDQNIIVGMIKVIPWGFCNLYPYLALLSVHRDYQKNGVGSFLLKAFEEIGRLEGAGKGALLVSDFNETAQQYYSKKGYYTIGLIPNALREGIGEYLMIKDFM